MCGLQPTVHGVCRLLSKHQCHLSAYTQLTGRRTRIRPSKQICLTFNGFNSQAFVPQRAPLIHCTLAPSHLVKQHLKRNR